MGKEREKNDVIGVWGVIKFICFGFVRILGGEERVRIRRMVGEEGMVEVGGVCLF